MWLLKNIMKPTSQGRKELKSNFMNQVSNRMILFQSKLLLSGYEFFFQYLILNFNRKVHRPITLSLNDKQDFY